MEERAVRASTKDKPVIYPENRTKVETVTPFGTTTRYAPYATDDALLCMSDGTTRTTYFYSARGSLASKVEMTTSADSAANPPPTCADNACAETTYGYDAMGNLTAVVLPDDTFIEYQSDAAGRRVAKRINGVVVARWLWDGQLRPIAELAPDGSVTSGFVYADGVNSPEYMVRGGAEYTFVKDALGSVRQVLDSNGVVMQAISYDAWGVPTATVGSLDYQPFGFAGGLWDADTGLVRFGARDYDASIGRWTAKDPIRFGGGQVNLYVYVENEPVNLIDPQGLMAVEGAVAGGLVAGPPGMVIGAVLGAAVAVAVGWWIGDTLSDIVYAKPPDNAYDPEGPKAPGKPSTEVGFCDPKDGEDWVKDKRGKWGWRDINDEIWVPTGHGNGAHGGPHWDVQGKRGRYRNVYPGGTTRPGRNR